MLELFETPLTVLHIVVCFFLILVVLIQPGKSGGLGAALGGAGAQQVFGGRGAGNFLSRVTWICAGLFFVTSMVLAYVSSSADDTLQERAADVSPSPLAADDSNVPARGAETPVDAVPVDAVPADPDPVADPISERPNENDPGAAPVEPTAPDEAP